MTGQPSAPDRPADLAPLAVARDTAKGAAGVEVPAVGARGADGDIEGVRGVWWSLARQGQRLPAQRGVIFIRGGRP